MTELLSSSSSTSIVSNNANNFIYLTIYNKNIPGFLRHDDIFLCVPILIVKIWSHIPRTQLFQSIEKLKISISQCNQNELILLKNAKELPEQTYSCGLLKKVDVELLCETLLPSSSSSSTTTTTTLPLVVKSIPSSSFSSCSSSSLSTTTTTTTGAKESTSSSVAAALLSSSSSSSSTSTPPTTTTARIFHKKDTFFLKYNQSIPVKHYMHSRKTPQYGEIYPLKYIHPSSPCIHCNDCLQWFTMETFICHTHSKSSQTVHWGRNPKCWRDYLLLNCDEENSQDYSRQQLALKEIKEKFLKEKDNDNDKNENISTIVVKCPALNHNGETLPPIKRHIIDHVEANVVPFGSLNTDMRSSSPPPNVFLKLQPNDVDSSSTTTTRTTSEFKSTSRWIVCATTEDDDVDYTDSGFHDLDATESVGVTNNSSTHQNAVSDTERKRRRLSPSWESRPRARCVTNDMPANPVRTAVLHMLHSVMATPMPAEVKMNLFQHMSHVHQVYQHSIAQISQASAQSRQQLQHHMQS